MSYLVLARKWRPRTFEDLIGQENISLTLKNAIATGKLAQALVFSGPRGVGKTSTARIVAKTLNCQNEDPSRRPCSDSQCTFCREVTEGKSFDVQEIDAASHTGVNDIREIIGNVKYLPTSGSTKVYIIDEVHMLSQAAFNALLKTLEEPPSHVLFVLATTEIHKIPATILSRCQRYDFRKIPVVKIKDTLERISKTENISIDEKTLYLVSKEADGSLRDALSLMDQLIATFGDNINHDEAVAVLGLMESTYIKSVLSEIINKNPGKCIEYLQKAFGFGINPKKFAEELTRMIRAVLFLKICGPGIVLEYSDDEKNELIELVKDETPQSLEMLFKLMLESSENIQRSFYPAMALESSIVRLCVADRTLPIEEILKKIEKLGANINTGKGKTPGPGAPPAPADKGTTAGSGKKEYPKPESKTLKDNTNSYSGEQDGRDFSKEDFLARIKESNMMMGIHLDKSSSIEQRESSVVIKYPGKSIHYNYMTSQSAFKTLKDLAGNIYNLGVSIELDDTVGPESNGAGPEQEQKITDISEENIVKHALELFEGRIISTKYKEKE